MQMDPKNRGGVSGRPFTVLAVRTLMLTVLMLAVISMVPADVDSGAPVSGPEAEFGEIQYATVQEALDASDGTAPVYLLRNVTLDKALEADLSSKNITLDLRNYRVDIDIGGSVSAKGGHVFELSHGMIYDNRGVSGSPLGADYPAVRADGCILVLRQISMMGYAPSGSSGSGDRDVNCLVSVTGGQLIMEDGTGISQFRQAKGSMIAVTVENTDVSIRSGSISVDGLALCAKGDCDLSIAGDLGGGRGTGVKHTGTGLLDVREGTVSGSTAVSSACRTVISGGAVLKGTAAALELLPSSGSELAIEGVPEFRGKICIADLREIGTLTVTGGMFIADEACIRSAADVSVSGGTFIGPLDGTFLKEGYVMNPADHSVVEGITVSFTSMGEKVTEYVPANTPVSAPEPNVPEGKVFVCWKDANDNEWSPGALISEDTSYTAEYAVKMCDVRFYNGDGSIRSIQSAEYGSTPACDPGEITGYSFRGWNTSPDGTGTMLTEAYKVTDDVDFHAIWHIMTYGITFVDGLWESTDYLDYNEVITIHPAPVPPEGHGFAAWNTSEDGTGTDLKEGDRAVRDVKYYPRWVPDDIEITFVRIAEPLETKTVTQSYGTPIEPADHGFRYGYSFSGWNTSFSGEGEYLEPGTTASRDITYYAIWEPDLFQVSFINGTQVQEMELAYGQTVPAPEPVVRQGFKLLEWNSRSDGTGMAFAEGSVKVTGDMDFYAIWQQVAFKAEFLTDGTVFAEYYLDTGDAVIAPESVPEKADHVFVEWNTRADGSGDSYTEGTLMGTSDIRYHAVWSVHALFDITYTDRGQILAVFQKYAGDSLDDVSVIEPVRDGHSFMGWSVPLPALMPGHSLVLDALWQKDANHTISGTAHYDDSLSTPLQDGAVRLIRDGTAVASARTGQDGSYSIFDVSDGYYVLQCYEKGSSEPCWTGAVTVNGEDLTVNMPVDLRRTSINVVSDNGAPHITVYGLEALAQEAYSKYGADRISVRMLIDAIGADTPEGHAIAVMAGNRDMEFFDLSVMLQAVIGGNTVSVQMTETPLLRIVMPFDTEGKDGICMYRYHDGAAEAMKQIDGDTEPADGTYTVEDGRIVMYSSSFSLFAVVYEDSADIYPVLLVTGGIIAFLLLIMLYFSQWGVRVRR